MGDLQRYAAVNARVRTLLPSLLGRDELAALYTHPTPTALRDALSRTAYAPPLLLGGALEAAPLQRFLEVARATLRLLDDPERSFLRLYVLRHEMENLKVVIRGVHGQLPWTRLAAHLRPLGEIATVDAKQLAEARDLRELTGRLRRTPYEAPLRGALHRVDSAGPFALEVALELDYYDRLWAATDTLTAADAERARRLLGVLFDLLNLTWMARYRDGLGLAPEEILNYLLQAGRFLTSRHRRQLAEQRDEPWDLVLRGTPYAVPLAEVASRGFEAASTELWHFLAGECQREFGGYPFHIGVPLAFLLTQEIQSRDLCTLFAASNLGVPSGEALARLAGARP
jgi:V/A-type H+/Na+-transporting ATPase subunit C